MPALDLIQESRWPLRSFLTRIPEIPSTADYFDIVTYMMPRLPGISFTTDMRFIVRVPRPSRQRREIPVTR